jgi:hypothetical protein
MQGVSPSSADSTVFRYPGSRPPRRQALDLEQAGLGETSYTEKIVNWPSIIAAGLSSLMGSFGNLCYPCVVTSLLEASAASGITAQDH